MIEPWTVAAPVVAAPFVGSFLSVVVTRLPEGRGIVFGRSACPHCGQALGLRDLVPVASWLWRRGRCRTCGAAIGWLYPALELGAFGLALWAALAVPAPVVWWSCGFGWLLLALAAIDLRCLRLPDALTLPLGLGGLAFAGLMVPALLADHALGAALGFAACWGLAAAYRAFRGREGLGGGDARLLAAGGAWVSWEGLGGTMAIAAVSALLVVAGLLLGGRRLTGDSMLPFGPFLCLGLWLTWLYGPLMLG